MKTQAFWISIIIISITGLVFASRVLVPQPDVVVIEPELEVIDETPKTEPITKNGESLIPAGWKTVDGDDFIIKIPSTWLVSKIDIQSVDFFPILRLESGVADDAYIDPDIVNIEISIMPKWGRALAEITDTYALDESDVEGIIKTMTEFATPPYNEITAEDIKVVHEDTELNNGAIAKKITFLCLKECYLEGPAFSMNQYFLETPDSFFLLEAKTGTTEKTESLLLIAERVVKTFEMK